MLKTTITRRLLDPGIIAIIRADSSDHLVEAAEALYVGGITAMEVTMTTPNALQVIAVATGQFGGKIIMGVGSVINAETCRTAIIAGAGFRRDTGG